MAARVVISLRAIFEDIITGEDNIHPDDIVVDNPVVVKNLAIGFNTGDNTIFVHASYKGVIIIPDPLSTTVKTLKKDAADVGIKISNTMWTVLTFGSPNSGSFIINSVGAEAKSWNFIFF